MRNKRGEYGAEIFVTIKGGNVKKKTVGKGVIERKRGDVWTTSTPP